MKLIELFVIGYKFVTAYILGNKDDMNVTLLLRE